MTRRRSPNGQRRSLRPLGASANATHTFDTTRPGRTPSWLRGWPRRSRQAASGAPPSWAGLPGRTQRRAIARTLTQLPRSYRRGRTAAFAEADARPPWRDHNSNHRVIATLGRPGDDRLQKQSDRALSCLPRNLIRLNALTLRRVSSSHSGIRLRIQIFMAGFAVMALELLGSRLVTPIFGSSIWTWGSLIGVVLSGLAAGYRVGGWMADRSPTPRKFSMIVFAGGILVLLVPFIAPYALSLSQYAGLGDEYGPLLGTALILLLPTFVLGMTSPYAIKLASQTLSSVGNVSGNLYSLSTVGSIAGTFGTVFVFVPLLDVRVIILGLGLVVIGVSLLGLPKSSALFALLAFLVVSASLTQSAPQVALHNGSAI